MHVVGFFYGSVLAIQANTIASLLNQSVRLAKQLIVHLVIKAPV